jgi:subtilase family serine protease
MNELKSLKALFLLLSLCGLLPSLCCAQAHSTGSRVVQPVSESIRVVLKGSTHPFARFVYDTGVAPDELPLESIVLVLQRSPAQEAALQQLLIAQQMKASPNFHNWISPAEFGARFGPSEADISALTSWLTSQGFAVKPVSGGRTVLEFSGTAGQLKRAFHTEIHKYNIEGQMHLANNRDPEIPAAFAPIVRGVLSLNDFSRKSVGMKVQNFVMSKSSGKLTPEVTLAAGCTSTGNCYGVGPADFATIYDINPLYTAGIDGTGETIAIASSTNINIQDARSFRQIFNLPAKDPNIIVVGQDPGAVLGEEGFTTLQVQWAGAIAKNSAVDLVVSQSTAATDGTNLSAIYVINNNLAPILTFSFTDCEPVTGAGGAQFYQFLWEQAAAEGITVIAPAGDTGAAACDNHFTEIAASQGIAVNALASTVYNVAVGGTDFNQVGNWAQYWNATNDPNTLASAKSYIPEVTWNDSCAENGVNGCTNPNASGSDLVAGGGGFSIDNAIPSWQSGLGVSASGGRVLPDISLFAGDGNNGSFYLLCQGDANSNGDPACNINAPFANIQGAGGTAASAAAFAGIMALVDQYNHGPQGNANLVLYPLSSNAAAGAFHDVTQGSTSVACVGGSFQDCSNAGAGFGIIADVNGAIWSASPGYDLATGLGSVDVNNLVTKWSSVSFLPTTTTIVSVNPPAPTHGQAVSFAINVNSASGTPTGDVALMVNPSGSAFAADVFTLVGGTITASTTKLPGGSYSIVAHYAGDGKFAPSDSAPFTINVAPQASQTTLSIEDFSNGPLDCFDSGQQEQFGAVYYLRVVVGNPGDTQASPSNCYPLITSTNTPTGTVKLTDNGNPLGTGTYTLNGRGYLELPTQPVGLGQHQITATYSGDSSYGTSSAGTGSAPTPFFFVTITQTNAQILLSASATTVAAGANVTVTATVTNTNRGSVAAPPSGLVTFLRSDGTTLGTATLAPTIIAGATVSTASLTFAPTQSVTVSAQYAGDANYFPVSSIASLTINIGNPDFAVVYAPANLSLTSGQSGTATITVTPSLGFTGAVALACPAASALPLGMSCSISPATVTPGVDGKPVTAILTLNSQAPSVILASAKPARPAWILTMASGSMVFAGLFFLGGQRRKQLALICAVLLVTFSCGSCATVVKPGASPVSALTLTTSRVKSPLGAPVTLTAAVSADHVVSGTVDFFDNGTPVAQGVGLQVGRASFTSSSLTLGAHPITATYSGDDSTHSAKASTPLEQVITGGAQLQITATSGNLTHILQVQFILN